MSYYNASLKHNSYAECLEEGPDRQINEKKVVEKLVGPREKNVRDHLVYQQQFVIQEKREGRKVWLLWLSQCTTVDSMIK